MDGTACTRPQLFKDTESMSEALMSGQISLHEEPKAGDTRLTRLKLHTSTGKGILKDPSWDFMNLYQIIQMKIDLKRKIY